jgi:hypothetical protein
VFDSITNKYGYRSKLHEWIIPSAVKRTGKRLLVHENIVCIKDCFTRRQMVKTPVKTRNINSYDDVEDLYYLTGQEEIEEGTDDKKISTDDALQEMEQLLPRVLNTMLESGKLESYIKFNRLISNGNLPMNNVFISFLCRPEIKMNYILSF